MSITTQQIVESLAAVLGFVPVAVCPGYVAAWLTNLYGFRGRSLVERVFWSVPLSFAVAPIGAVLVGRFTSLNVAVTGFALCAVMCAGLLVREMRQRSHARDAWRIRLGLHGGAALCVAAALIATIVLSLVDIERGQRLWTNVAILDQSYRVDWIQAVLRTGVPPSNPQYWFHGAAPMHNYYFWYVVCAVVARMTHLPARAVMDASSVWAAFLFAAVTGLYLKHFLAVGSRLRAQFLRALLLFFVTGLDLCYIAWEIVALHQSPEPDLEAWSKDGIISWLHTMLWAPHHLAGLLCCMFGFLLVWLAGSERGQSLLPVVLLTGAALASAFGTSVYVTFAFFLVMVVWALWQLGVERAARRVALLAVSGGIAIVLLVPYLFELTHTSSGMHGGAPFALTVRQMIPPDGLLAQPFLQHMAAADPAKAQVVAKLLLLLPGYAIELGFYGFVFAVFLVPRLRRSITLTEAQRTLLLIGAAALPAMTFLRSSVLTVNDFGWRSALLLQYPLLLLATELLMSWNTRKGEESTAVPQWNTPQWLRGLASLALVVGFFGTVCQAISLRFAVPLAEATTASSPDWKIHAIPHGAYISARGYAALDKVIPRDAVVQFDPIQTNPYWTMMDVLNVDRQTAITGDHPWCGAELGGDPEGCAPMAAAIDALYRGATDAQARATCRQIGIQYLVARIYDPAWKQANSWVWTLRPVVAQPEFRVLDCR